MKIIRIIDGHLQLTKKGNGGFVKVETNTGELNITPEQYWLEIGKKHLIEKIDEGLVNNFIDIVTAHVKRTIADEQTKKLTEPCSLN